MKKLNTVYRWFLTVLLLQAVQPLSAQVCSAGFNYTIGLNNTLTFVSTCSPALASTSYTWNFGAGYLLPVTGVGPAATQTSATYTNTGTFIVSITMTNTVPACSQTFTAAVTVTNCAINFSNSPASGSLCTGAATAAAQGFCGPITYSWSGAGVGAIKNALCPGTYTVIAAGNNPSCCPQAAGVVVINTINPCPLNAAFQYTLQPNGLVNFSSTSTGTTASSQYVWTFGDGGSGNNVSTSHTYTAPGFYSAFLTVINNSITCRDTSLFQTITPFFCNLSLSATANYSGTSSVFFSGSASGTYSTSTYSWRFGDGSNGTGLNAIHSYSTPGTYTVTFRVDNNTVPVCRDSIQIVVNSNCSLNSNFTHTVLANGLVHFNSPASNTLSGTTFNWNFGDGYGDIAPSPYHQYTNGGTHFVKLKINRSGYPACADSITQAINITGVPCSATAQFMLSPSGIPQQWWAIPAYPYNVSTAIWSWGDGSSSTGLYSGHTYSAAGNYSICLSVTLSCNATASFCTTQYLSKAAGSGIIQVNIKQQALKLGVSEVEEENDFIIFPNPNTGHFTLQLSNAEPSTMMSIRDISGRLVVGPIILEDSKTEIETNLPLGFYFIEIRNSKRCIKKKIIIE